MRSKLASQDLSLLKPSAGSPTGQRNGGQGGSDSRERQLDDSLESAILTMAQGIQVQVDSSLSRQLETLTSSLRSARGEHKEADAVADQFSASCRAAIRGVLDGILHKSLHELAVLALESPQQGRRGSESTGSNLVAHARESLAGGSWQLARKSCRTSQRRSSDVSLCPGVGPLASGPSEGQSTNRKDRMSSFSDEDGRTSQRPSIGIQQKLASRMSMHASMFDEKALTKVVKDRFAPELPGSNESSFTKGTKTLVNKGRALKHRMSIFVGTANPGASASPPQARRLPSALKKESEAKPSPPRSPAAAENRHGSLSLRNADDRIVLRALQAGHSAADAVQQAKGRRDSRLSICSTGPNGTQNSQNGGDSRPTRKASMNPARNARLVDQLEQQQVTPGQVEDRPASPEDNGEDEHSFHAIRSWVLEKWSASACRCLKSAIPMMEPLSVRRLIWEVIISLASICALAIMPLAWAFPDFPRTVVTVVGSVTCPVFFMQIVVKLRTAVPQYGVLTRNAKVVAYQYLLSSAFLADLLAAFAFPLQLLTSDYVTLLHIVTLRPLLHAANSYERASKSTNARRRIIVLCITSLVQLHWITCVWAKLADPDKSIRAWLRGIDVDAPDELMPMTWLTTFNSTLHAPRLSADWVTYLYSLYWVLAITTTIGFGDVLPVNELEMAVMCVTIIVSALLYSSLIAYMSNLILSSDVNWTAHKQKVETIKSYMRHRKIPSELQARIEEYLDYLWTTQKGLDESTITAMLPATLKQQLSLFCNSRIISTVPLFADVPEYVSAAIVAQLQPKIFVPDDMIISKGDWADEMFLIYRGVVKLVELSEAEDKSIYLKDGDYFGEIAVLTGGRRMMSIRAVTYCHLYSLQQRLLERILQQHPECIDSLLVNMMHNYENFDQIKAQIFAVVSGPQSEPQAGSFSDDNSHQSAESVEVPAASGGPPACWRRKSSEESVEYNGSKLQAELRRRISDVESIDEPATSPPWHAVVYGSSFGKRLEA